MEGEYYLVMKKKILIILNYYVPYISGVTEYARLAAERLVQEGYEVHVLTSNHANLPKYEVIHGVKVHRAKVLFKISKGVVSAEFLILAKKLSKDVDCVNLHLPMLEAGLIAKMVPKEKLVTMYQCDVNLPKSILNYLIVKTMDFSHTICLKKSRIITVTSVDYASHSRVASKFTEKLFGIAAPIKEYYPVPVERDYNTKIIGFCGRIVEEKGVDILIKAYEQLQKEIPNIRLKIAGDYKNVAGGSVYPQLAEYISNHNIRGVEFLGKIKEEDMATFFSGLDVFVLPSVNSLEAFGMVQIEAMRCGAPIVASDLYGVRTIVQNTGAGEICKAGDVASLVDCLRKVLVNKDAYVKTISQIETVYSNNIWGKKYIEAIEG